MSKTKKSNSIPKHLIVVGAVLIILAIVFVVLILKQGSGQPTNNQVKETENNTSNQDSLEATNINSDIFNPETDSIETVGNLDTAIATTVGSNLITQDGKVVNDKGQVVQNNALPMTDFAPRLSEPVDPNSLIEGVIKIRADENGFSPSEFTVLSGEPVTLSLSAIGLGSRLVFENKSLIALELPVPADYTMAKTFNAPAPGRYVFYQDMPGRINQKGVMIVE